MMVDIVSLENNGYRGVERNLLLPFKNVHEIKKISKVEFNRIIEEHCYCERIVFENDDDAFVFREIKSFYLELVKRDVKCEMIFASEDVCHEFCGCQLEYLGVDVVFDGGLSALLYGKDELALQLNENGLFKSLKQYNEVKELIKNLVKMDQIYPFFVYKILI